MKRRMRTTGQIARLFKEADSGTMVRKPNMRRFSKDNGVFYHILSNGKWIIDIDEFLMAVNPKQNTFHIDMPRLRRIASSVTLFSETYPAYDIDRHYTQNLGKFKIVSGGAQGADTLAKKYAIEFGHEITEY